MTSQKSAALEFISIAVADSTRIHTQLLAEAINKDQGLQVVVTASNSTDLLAAVLRAPIDVLVLSHNLDTQPGRGLQTLREMRALRPQIKGIILLDSTQPEVVLDCFRAGAKGIFSKEERMETLCRCIRSVHEGQIWARSVELDHALEALASSPSVRATNHKGIELLSTRERQVIQYLAAGMTNREIASALKLSPHTVKNYLFRIFDKLGVSSRTELLFLTMNSSSGDNGQSLPFTAMLEAADAGDPSAQVRLAEHYGKHGAEQHDPVSAYMWYLLARHTAVPLLHQIEEGEQALRRSMSEPQVHQAEERAAQWLKSKKKFAASADLEPEPK